MTKRLALLPALLLLAAGPLQADVDRTKRPEPGPAPEASFPDYKQETLPNGLRVFLIEDDRKPTITLRLIIRSGSMYDGKKSGLASAVATLLARGTAMRDAATFAQQSDFIGAQLMQTTGPDSIAVSMSGLTKYTNELLDLFSDAVLRPAFAEEQFTKVQRQTLSALASEKKQPGALAGKLGGKVLYGQHPYGAYRTAETVKAITRDDVV